VITALEALRLPGAQLTDQQRQILRQVLADIDAWVRSHMQRCGVEMNLRITDANIVAEVSRLLRRASWNPQWLKLSEAAKVQGAEPLHIGYRLLLAPEWTAPQILDLLDGPTEVN
jgi:hypothetical protein